MLLGFQRQFIPYLLDHSKRHTIRAMRKRPFRVGDICHCYGNVRRKTEFLIGRWPCIKTGEVVIYRAHEIGIEIDGVKLNRDEKDSLAWADGFRPPGISLASPGMALHDMAEFWRARLADVSHWNGQII